MGRIGQFIKDAGRRQVLPTVALYIVAAWVAIQVADLAIDAGVLRWALRDVFVAAFLGFPVTLIVAWFYDVTRRGIARTPPVGADASFDKSLHKRDYLLFASLAAVWAVAIVFVHTPTPVDKSIAILPFENLGHDPNNAMFAFGIRVDLQTQLQNLHDLKIIARESSDKIESDMSLREIGLKLGAAYIMKGSVERVLDRVRISVTLIDTEEGRQTWASNYDRELTASNWFDIRNEISSVITDSLQAELSPAEQDRLETVPTENFAAHQAYLHGKQRMAKRTVGTLAEAIDYFQQAIELDPNYALAYVGLADTYYLHMLYGRLPEDDMLPKMEAAIDKALELDDQLGEAYAILGALQYRKNDLAAAEVAFKRALELNPNYATAHQWYGTILGNLGRREEGLAQKRKAQELDPLSAIINHSIGLTLEILGRIDEALAQYKIVIEIDPAFPNPYDGTARIYWEALGQLDEAVAWFRKSVALDPAQAYAPTRLALIYLDLGDSDQAEFWFNRSLQLAPSPYWQNASNEILQSYRGQEAKAQEYGRELLMIDPQSVRTLAHLRNHDFKVGRYAEARARYERAYPALLKEDQPTIDEDNLQAAIDLALVLTRTGEQERAEMLLNLALAFLQTARLHGNGYEISDVRIYALQGKTEAALAALRQLIDQGWRTTWWFSLERDPNLDSIRDEPEFQTMLEEVKADMAAQLERVRAMEASAELESIPDIN